MCNYKDWTHSCNNCHLSSSNFHSLISCIMISLGRNQWYRQGRVIHLFTFHFPIYAATVISSCELSKLIFLERI